jgi:hypothetical protein
LTDGSARIARRAGVQLTRTGGEALLVDEHGGYVHVINGSAARLWELCENDPTLDELATALGGSYALEAPAVCDDVEQMVGTLRDLGLVEVTP